MSNVTQLPLTSSQARLIVRHLFGSSANINSGPTYYIVTLDGHVLAEGHNVFVAIRDALRTHCKRTGEDAGKLLEKALAAFREAREKGIRL